MRSPSFQRAGGCDVAVCGDTGRHAGTHSHSCVRKGLHNLLLCRLRCYDGEQAQHTDLGYKTPLFTKRRN